MINRFRPPLGVLLLTAIPLWSGCSGNTPGGTVTTLGCTGPGFTTDPQGRVVRFGTVSLESESERVAGVTQSLSFASAVFQTVSTAQPCIWASTIMGPCQVVHCMPPEDGGGAPAQDAGASTQPNAWTIRITGGAKLVTLKPMADGSYDSYGDNTPLWSGGETLSISAEGAVVPEFSTSLTAPGQPTVTAPVLPSTAPLSVERTQDLHAAWTGGAGASVEIDLVTYNQARGAAITARCIFSGTSGAIPASVLNLFPAAEPVHISAAGFSCKDLTAGDWTIQPYAYSEAMNAAGLPFNGALSVR